MTDGQPGVKFLKQIRVFNPSRLALMSRQLEDYSAIPGMMNVTSAEFERYYDTIGPEAVQSSVCGVVDLDLFWNGLCDRLPKLSAVACAYKDVVTSSADVERSNSIYKIILGARRRSLSEKNLKALLFLHFNNNQPSKKLIQPVSVEPQASSSSMLDEVNMIESDGHDDDDDDTS